MLRKYTDKNKYGGFTWEIVLDTTLKIQIQETNNSSFVVDFKESKLFGTKTHFSYISNEDMEDTIIESINKVYDFLKGHKDFIGNARLMEIKKIQILSEWHSVSSTSYNNVNSQNSKEWIAFISETEIPDEFKKVIETFFIPDKIRLERYANNNMILNYNGFIPEGVTATNTFEAYFTRDYFFNKPMGSPEWFICAYPDVSIWFQKNYETFKDDFANDNARYFDDDDITKETHPIALRWMINRYLSQGRTLECSI